ncbi:MAG: DUF3046 domain-containing protein [Kineosporiaceae bacterium]
MRHTQFWTLVEEEFGGAYGRMLVREHVLRGLSGRTAEQAIADGVPVREVWLALCEELEVPPARRWGVPLQPGQRGYVPPDARG